MLTDKDARDLLSRWQILEITYANLATALRELSVECRRCALSSIDDVIRLGSANAKDLYLRAAAALSVSRAFDDVSIGQGERCCSDDRCVIIRPVRDSHQHRSIDGTRVRYGEEREIHDDGNERQPTGRGIRRLELHIRRDAVERSIRGRDNRARFAEACRRLKIGDLINTIELLNAHGRCQSLRMQKLREADKGRLESLPDVFSLTAGTIVRMGQETINLPTVLTTLPGNTPTQT